METKQSFNLSTDFSGGYSALFIKLVFVIIAVYLIILLINFFRDKFINQEPCTKKDNITDLLTILHKLFYVSGFGFMLANLVQVLLSELSESSRFPSLNLVSQWDYLLFGIIVVFIGIGCKLAKKVLNAEHKE